MNISTGGPHILLFERDQQLAALLTSELQLAGYESHIARTAVEVFDAIARFPVRIVLINLAQAAASRREFWVALDTQRRGSGIQVFTFHCSNLASYGPRDPDDYSQASMADMEIDGMLGLMKLVDTVRARVPGAEGSAVTMPRIPRTPTQSSSSVDLEMMQASDDTPSPVKSRTTGTSLLQPSINTTSSPTMPAAQGTSQPYPATSPATQLPGGNQSTYSDKIRAVLYPNSHSPNPHAWSSSENNNASPRYNSYVEQDATPIDGTARSYPPQRPAVPAPPSSPGTSVLQRLANGQIYSSPGLAELSRLVNGGTAEENARFAYESWRPEGMRLSPNMPAQVAPQAESFTPNHMPVEHRSAQPSPVPPLPAQSETNITNNYQFFSNQAQTETVTSEPQDRDYQLRAAPIQDLPLERPASQAGYSTAIKSPEEVSRAKEMRPRSMEASLSAPQSLQPQLPTQTPTSVPAKPLASADARPVMSTASSSAGLNGTSSVPAQSVESMTPVSREKATTPLPLEPLDRREGFEAPRRSDRSRDFIDRQDDSEASRRSDRSKDPMDRREIPETLRRSDRSREFTDRREGFEAPRRSDRSRDFIDRQDDSEAPRRSDRSKDSMDHRENSETLRRSDHSREFADRREGFEAPRQSDYSKEFMDRRENSEAPRRSDHPEAPLYQDIDVRKEIDESADRNAVILDILQSLPAITVPSDQQEQRKIEPQVHNGRATRSLGSVLLDGHLVPQDRLEVAQNIQRMLRGVDLNYQLGEILLMFKLLTPDQLLAASLLSYGLITTTQISALGRIRQELHAIGLEYDLENLVILFRILSPEQLREARSNVQN